MTSVLILFFTGGYGAAVTAHEFENYNACVAAGVQAAHISLNVRFVCAPKGTPLDRAMDTPTGAPAAPQMGFSGAR